MKNDLEIVEEMIQSSFRSISLGEVLVYEGDTGGYTALAGPSPFSEGYRIMTHPRVRVYTEEEKRGVFAHELSHVESYVSKSSLHLFFHLFVAKPLARFLIPGTDRIVERATDMTAIEKGYGRELFACRTRRIRELEEVSIISSDNYLSPTEIKEAAMRIGKW